MVPITMKGKFVVVKFLDHSTYEDAEPVDCETMGRVVEVTPIALTLEWWSVLNPNLDIANGRERTCIIQSTIYEYQELKGKKGKRI